MSARFDWDLAPEDVPAPVDTDAHRPEEKPPGFSVPTYLLIVYVLAMVIAGWFGFNLGRWSVAEQAQIWTVENQLALEQLAWQEGDVELFHATLHPDSPPQWQGMLLSQFEEHAPRDYEVSLEEREAAGDNLVDVRVDVVSGGERSSQMRRYKLISGSWLRVPADSGLE